MDDQNKGNQGSGTSYDGPVHGTAEGQEPEPTQKPSQAEGDRDTIDQDLTSKGQGEEQQ